MKFLLLIIFIEIILCFNSSAQVPEATSGFGNPLTGAFSNNGGYTFLEGAYYSGNLVYHPGEDWNQPTLNGGCSTGCSIDRCLDVNATANGKVVFSNTSVWGGIVIQHNYQNQTWYSQYGHIINSNVTVGQNVTKGQKIAEIGNTGTDCAHLHFEIRESDHPNPTNGSYFTYGNSGIGNYNNVVNWYEDPDIFIASHPAYSNSNVNCTFSVNSNHSLDHWKFWKNPSVPADFYSVTLDITNLPGGSFWSLYILNPNDSIISDVRLGRSETHYSFTFSANENDPNYPNAFGYRFRLTPNGFQNTTWALSDQFYISSLPTLTINISPPGTIYIGMPATLNWFTSGGIPGVPNGGWTGNIRFQWYNGNNALNNLDSVPVSLGTYQFIVPNNVPGSPGVGFKIGAANAVVGTSIPGGYVSDFTDPFSIQLFSGVSSNTDVLPESFALKQNYPNPFNPETKIEFNIPEKVPVNLTVFDMNGREIKELINMELRAGIYTYSFNGSEIPSGTYIYRLSAGKFTEERRMILIK